MYFTKAVRRLKTHFAEFLRVKSYMVLAVEAYYEKNRRKIDELSRG